MKHILLSGLAVATTLAVHAMEVQELPLLELMEHYRVETDLGCLVRLAAGKQLLHKAVQQENVRAVKLLIENQADIDEQDEQHKTPLHWATELGSQKMVMILIQEGATINAGDKQKKKPLHYAVENNNQTALHYAIENGNTELISLLVKHDADVNADCSPTISPQETLYDLKHNYTPLYAAVVKGSPEIVALLLEKGAITNRPSTLLHDAIKQVHKSIESYKEIIDMLIEAGTPIDQPNPYGESPLFEAICSHNPELVEFLLNKGASVKNPKNSTSSDTIMHKVVRLYGSQILTSPQEKAYKSSKKLFNHLLSNNDVAKQIIKQLVAAGAALDAQDYAGKTPLDYAKDREWAGMVNFLRELKTSPTQAPSTI